tara:strand:+ start:17 stop:1606 length:1590 start_codon:yes stop_codon:yes gene_type:complete
MFNRCEYNWWYTYGPMKRRSPGSDATWLGSVVHLALEEYMLGRGIPTPEKLSELMLEDRNLKDLSEKKRTTLARKALKISSVDLDKLPEPGTMEIEASLDVPCGPAVMTCRIDMMSDGYIGDHKTTSNLSWAKSSVEVRHDVQLKTYAYAAFHKDPPKEVTVELLYRTTRGMCHFMAVSEKIPWQEIVENWEEMAQFAARIVAHKYDSDPSALKPNQAACKDYGKACYQSELCPFSPNNRGKTQMKRHSSKAASLRDKLGVSRIVPPDAPKQEEQTPVAIAEAKVAIAKAPEMKDRILNDRGISEEQMGLADDIVAALEPETKKLEIPLKEESKKSLTTEDLRSLAETMGMEDGEPVADVKTELRMVIENDYGRKLTPARWKRFLKMANFEEDNGVLRAVGQVTQPKVVAFAEELSDELGLTQTSSEGMVSFPLLVLVDCHFEKTPEHALTLSDFVAPYMQEVEEQYSVEYYDLIEYGEGAKKIAWKIKADVNNIGHGCTLIIDSRDPLAGRVLSILRRIDGVGIIHGR